MIVGRYFLRQLAESPEAKRFVLNALAVGELDGGRELARVARHCGSQDLQEKLRKHFRDEMKHAGMFRQHLRVLGYQPEALDADLDYEKALQSENIGLSTQRLDDPRPLSQSEYASLFCCIKVTEDRAWSNTRMLKAIFASDNELLTTFTTVLEDETWHRSYASEELGKLAHAGWGREIQRLMRAYRRREARAYLTVTLPYLERIGCIVGWPRPLRSLMKMGCRLQYLSTVLIGAYTN